MRMRYAAGSEPTGVPPTGLQPTALRRTRQVLLMDRSRVEAEVTEHLGNLGR